MFFKKAIPFLVIKNKQIFEGQEMLQKVYKKDKPIFVELMFWS